MYSFLISGVSSNSNITNWKTLYTGCCVRVRFSKSLSSCWSGMFLSLVLLYTFLGPDWWDDTSVTPRTGVPHLHTAAQNLTQVSLFMFGTQIWWEYPNIAKTQDPWPLGPSKVIFKPKWMVTIMPPTPPIWPSVPLSTSEILLLLQLNDRPF